MASKEVWRKLQKDYPAIVKQDEDDVYEPTPFEKWVEGMGYDLFIAIDGVKKDEKES